MCSDHLRASPDMVSVVFWHSWKRCEMYILYHLRNKSSLCVSLSLSIDEQRFRSDVNGQAESTVCG